MIQSRSATGPSFLKFSNLISFLNMAGDQLK